MSRRTVSAESPVSGTQTDCVEETSFGSNYGAKCHRALNKGTSEESTPSPSHPRPPMKSSSRAGHVGWDVRSEGFSGSHSYRPSSNVHSKLNISYRRSVATGSFAPTRMPTLRSGWRNLGESIKYPGAIPSIALAPGWRNYEESTSSDNVNTHEPFLFFRFSNFPFDNTQLNFCIRFPVWTSVV